MSSGIDSAKSKLLRAAEHLNVIHFDVSEYLKRKPYEITTNPDGKQTLNVLRQPPSSLAIIVGEVVYQIRSALDHLAFDLVKNNPNISTIDPEWCEHCEFPLWGKPLAAGITFLPQTKFERVLPGISKQAFTFIEKVQPYHRRDGSPARHLWFLAQLSNIDKHRHLNLVLAKTRKIEIKATLGELPEFTVTTFHDGAEIPISEATTDGTVYMDARFLPLVGFDEHTLGVASALPIQNVLKACLDTVEGVIVPAFEKFIKNP